VACARRGLALDEYAINEYCGQARPVAGDPRLHRVLGQLREKQGRLGAAAIQYVRAFCLSTGRAQAALGLDLQDALHAGDVHEKLGLVNEALTFWHMAEQDPKLAAAAQERSQRLIDEVQGHQPR
jgi:hypothetical protein